MNWDQTNWTDNMKDDWEWTDLHLAGRRDDQEDPHGGRQEVVALGRHPWSRRPGAPVSRVRHPHMLRFIRPRPSRTT